MSVYCGGAGVQHNIVNKGRCAICGDVYKGDHKQHEAGGKYATGIIARSYREGQDIDIEIEMVANHRGLITFAICPHNNMFTSPNRSCFEKNHLLVNNDKLFVVMPRVKVLKMKVSLPKGMTCRQCILQFTYTAGNSWGWGPQSAEVHTDVCLATKESQIGLLGCGMQETFRGCADICVGDFCPHNDQDTCLKVSDIKGSNLTSKQPTEATIPIPSPIKPAEPSNIALPPIKPIRVPQFKDAELPGILSVLSTGEIATPSNWFDQNVPPGHNNTICLQSGNVLAFHSHKRHQFCRKRCINQTVEHCFQFSKAQKHCYCITNQVFIQDASTTSPSQPNDFPSGVRSIEQGHHFVIRGPSPFLVEDPDYKPLVLSDPTHPFHPIHGEESNHTDIRDVAAAVDPLTTIHHHDEDHSPVFLVDGAHPSKIDPKATAGSI